MTASEKGPSAVVGAATLLAAAALALASWIFLPAPTYFLLRFGVGAPEISHWLLVAALFAVALSLPHVRRSTAARLAMVLGGATFVLAATPLVRLPATIRRFDAEFRPLSVPAKAVLLRAHPVVLADLFRGIPRARVRVGRAPIGDVYRPLGAGVFP